MRTPLDIDAATLDAAMRAGPFETKNEAAPRHGDRGVEPFERLRGLRDRTR